MLRRQKIYHFHEISKYIVFQCRILDILFDDKFSGVCWQLLPGGGCVVGDVDSLGEHSGDSIAYIYPDLSTALLGTFHQGELVR